MCNGACCYSGKEYFHSFWPWNRLCDIPINLDPHHRGLSFDKDLLSRVPRWTHARDRSRHTCAILDNFPCLTLHTICGLLLVFRCSHFVYSEERKKRSSQKRDDKWTVYSKSRQPQHHFTVYLVPCRPLAHVFFTLDYLYDIARLPISHYRSFRLFRVSFSLPSLLQRR